MNRIDFRTLKKEEILLRPQSVKDGKVTLLCYQDARCAMDILDERLGAFGWQKKYEEIKGNVYCSIGIKNEENGEWVWKSDCGAESNIEKEKGEASDATKRAAVCWGIGRELYSAPRIVVEDDGHGNTGYKISEIQYDEYRNIVYLVIVNKFGKEVFKWSVMDAPVAPAVVTKESIIQSIKDNANLEWKKEGANQAEIKKCADYWITKINKDGWKGNYFDWAKMYGSWLSRAS